MILQVCVAETIVDYSQGIHNKINSLLPPALQNAIAQAVQNAVGPAVENAVQNAMQPVTARLDRLEALIQNVEAKASNARRINLPDSRLAALRKTTAGHSVANPQDPALLNLAIPVPVGSLLPGLAFFPANGITRLDVTNLTDGEIDDLQWFYNHPFAGKFDVRYIACI